MEAVNKAFKKTDEPLSRAAAIPLLGTVAGLSKALIGTAEVVMALAIAFFTALPAAMLGSKELLAHTYKAVQHGFGNMARGLAESIPGLGSLMWIAGKRQREINELKQRRVKLEEKIGELRQSMCQAESPQQKGFWAQDERQNEARSQEQVKFFRKVTGEIQRVQSEIEALTKKIEDYESGK